MKEDFKACMPNKKRKRRYSDQKEKCYKELDVYVMKEGGFKTENSDQSKCKKRKVAVDLTNVHFPEDIDESFYQGQMNQSWHVHDSDDHTVPDNNKFMQDSENPIPDIPLVPRNKAKTKFIRTQCTRLPSLPSIAEEKEVSFSATPAVEKPFLPNISKQQQKLHGISHVQEGNRIPKTITLPKVDQLVPETPSLLKARFTGGQNHRQNSGFVVPETPFLMEPSKWPKKITIVEETPLLQRLQ